MLLLVSLLFAVSSAGLFGRKQDSTEWDTLQTTWSLTGFGGFYKYPLTEAEAIKDKWVPEMKCGDSGAPGNVYSFNGDLSSMPFYRPGDGKIAGIIIGMLNPGKTSEKAPFLEYKNATGSTFWGVEAHFRDPAKTCKPTTDDIKVGTGLWFAEGDSTYYQAPLNETRSTLTAAGWTFGACFFKMGNHWWRNIGDLNMSCNDTYPLFLLYHQSRLVAWGVAMAHDDRPYLSSDKWEHPQGNVLDNFFAPGGIPTCLPKQGVLSTQHVYMTNPSEDSC